jgi:hypothetical protein
MSDRKETCGEPQIRRHADGAIDFDYYKRRAHDLRQATLRRMLRGLARRLYLMLHGCSSAR